MQVGVPEIILSFLVVRIDSYDSPNSSVAVVHILYPAFAWNGWIFGVKMVRNKLW
jgi:hypothetical protein